MFTWLDTWHLLDVPRVSSVVVGVVVKEVNLLRSHLDGGVEGHHLQQSSGPAFPHSNDDAFRQPFHSCLWLFFGQVFFFYLLLLEGLIKKEDTETGT